jgi:hypothetical protein
MDHMLDFGHFRYTQTARDEAASERVDSDVGAMGRVLVIIQRRVFNEIHGNLSPKYQLAQSSSYQALRR